MAKIAPTLYQEVQLSPSPASPSSILHISTTGSSQQLTLFGAGRKRGHDEISDLDEEAYARKHLASEASVFFRSSERFPRSFLWRVLNDRQLLEIQAVDLVSQRGTQKEGWLTFRIALPAEVVRGGVAFADAEDTDALEVFVLTTGNELFTITLKRDLLTRDAVPSEFDANTIVKKYAPSAFAFRSPYRLLAVSSRELMVSLSDGGLLRLERQPNESATQWRETSYNEGGWGGTLKGLIPLKRRQTVRYGDLELEMNAAADIAMSPDGSHVWTVSLDHTLKAWNTKTGKVALQMDLLNERTDKDAQRRQPRYLLPAEKSTLIRVVQSPKKADDGTLMRTDEAERYCVVVHSPRDHEFKFYEISSSFSSIEGEGLRCIDMQPLVKLIPKIDELMNTNIWHLEEFHVHPGPGWHDTRLWIRARSGPLCKTYSLTSFNPLAEKDLDVEYVFQETWISVESGQLAVEKLKQVEGFPLHLSSSTSEIVATPSDRWLAYLFYPGRFTTASIEAALNTYRKRRKLDTSGGKGIGAPRPPLQERLTAAVSSKLLLHRSSGGQPDYDRYQEDIQAQWSAFFSILEELHKRRLDSLSLAYDYEDALPWLVGADTVAPVRLNDSFENMSDNIRLLLESGNSEAIDRAFPQDEDVFMTKLMHAAHELRLSLHADVQDLFRQKALQAAMSGEDENPVDGLLELHDSVGLNTEVSGDAYASLEANVEDLEGLGNVDGALFIGLMNRLDDTFASNGKDMRKELCRYGDKLSVAVAQESLQRSETVLLDVLVLTAFMLGGLVTDDLHPEFNPQSIYNEAMVRLRQTALRHWLASTARLEPVSGKDGDLITTTILGSFFGGRDWTSNTEYAAEAKKTGMPVLLTDWSKRWAYQLDLERDWTGVTNHVFSMLIQAKLYDHAEDFTKFMSSTSWSLYLQARLGLVLGEYDTAAIYFQEASEALATAERRPKSSLDTAGLLTDHEQREFYAGLSRYLQHVACLFEDLRAYSYTADFSAEALKHVAGADTVNQDIEHIDQKKRSHADSPAIDQANDGYAEIKLLQIKTLHDEIANRLFNALVQTGRFREAYDALRKTESGMEKANMRTLVEACLKQDAIPTLLQLPFTADLAAEADSVLLALARKTLSSGLTITIPHHQILYAFRTQRGDFRGAAEILYEYLERLRHGESYHLQDPEDETLLQAYLLLINTLACCGEGEAWLLADPIEGLHDAAEKRKLVTLEEVRREYVAELDRRSDMVQGRFPLVGGGEEMDVF